MLKDLLLPSKQKRKQHMKQNFSFVQVEPRFQTADLFNSWRNCCQLPYDMYDLKSSDPNRLHFSIPITSCTMRFDVFVSWNWKTLQIIIPQRIAELIRSFTKPSGKNRVASNTIIKGKCPGDLPPTFLWASKGPHIGQWNTSQEPVSKRQTKSLFKLILFFVDW